MSASGTGNLDRYIRDAKDREPSPASEKKSRILSLSLFLFFIPPSLLCPGKGKEKDRSGKRTKRKRKSTKFVCSWDHLYLLLPMGRPDTLEQDLMSIMSKPTQERFELSLQYTYQGRQLRHNHTRPLGWKTIVCVS